MAERLIKLHRGGRRRGRLYDTFTGSHVSLHDVYRMIRSCRDAVLIVDIVTGEDVTAVTVARAVYERLRLRMPGPSSRALITAVRTQRQRRPATTPPIPE
jgi:hypothetical protein